MTSESSALPSCEVKTLNERYEEITGRLKDRTQSLEKKRSAAEELVGTYVSSREELNSRSLSGTLSEVEKILGEKSS